MLFLARDLYLGFSQEEGFFSFYVNACFPLQAEMTECKHSGLEKGSKMLL